MDRIAPHPLWLGDAAPRSDVESALKTGIKAVIDLALEEPPAQPPCEIVYCRLPLVDGRGNDRSLLQLSITVVADVLRGKVPTLVYGGTRRSRSPAIAAAALSLVHQDSASDWLKRIAGHYPCDVSRELWQEVVDCLDSMQGMRGLSTDLSGRNR